MIEVRHVTKSFGSRLAVDDLSFSVQPGQVTGFLGPNGAGKSTTMKMILGLTRPTSGAIRVLGKSPGEIDRPLTSIGGLLDSSWVHPNRSARAHLRWMAAYSQIPYSQVVDVLNQTGLTPVADLRAGKFSLGMKQRLGLAGALLGNPKVLVLDEPLNGLDPEGIGWMKETLQALAHQGKTILLSSHLLAEISSTCEHLIVIGRGKLVADSSVKDFVAGSGAHRVRVRAENLALISAELRARHFDFSESDDALGRPMLEIERSDSDSVGRAVAGSGVTLLELTEVAATLETAFMESTRDQVEFGTAVVSASRAEGAE